MIYELRRYQLTSPPMAQHFNDHMSTMLELFDEHDLSVVGSWDAVIGTSLPYHLYMLRWRDLGHRERSWASFYEDERFWVARERMNERAGGTVVSSHDIAILKPGSYSPLDRVP
jgi:hypothetical protein